MPQPVVSTIQRLEVSLPKTQTELRPARAATSLSVKSKGEPEATAVVKGSRSGNATRRGAGQAPSHGRKLNTHPVRVSERRNDLRELRRTEIILPLCAWRCWSDRKSVV